MTSVVWEISIGRFGDLPGCAPCQLLHACLLAEYGKLEKVLDFTAITKTISVINTVLVLTFFLS